ncbi:hypothetical protein ACEWY4_025284 [Coilia grayii]|uniref:DNA excision repair protein ERCC-6-like 2 n=1 Tax=Coilia grayii TaxID=363190 RepID=A0ABD1IZ55_9TELE
MSGILGKQHEDKKQKEEKNKCNPTTSRVREKPFFHLSQRPPGESVPFALSKYLQVPYTINRYLRDYQREGVKFIFDNYMKSRGCILGDDMGLGKTVQVISFLAAVLRKTGTWEDAEKNVPHFLLSQKSAEKNKVKKVYLIIAPLSLLYNWKEELDTWGYFKVAIVHGVEKRDELARVKKGRCEIALTTYETFRLSLDEFNSINWAAVIVDEAHKIKNWKSQITKAMKKMRCKVRVGLTGTILQNNLEELYCVMDWAIPWCLGGFRQFKKNFADPIEHGQKHSVTKRTLAVGRQAVQALAQRLSGKFLRRTKALISNQLPAKDDRVVYCSLTEFQQAVYISVLESDDVVLLMRSGQSCTCGSKEPRKKCCYKTNSKGIRVRDLYFSYLTILRKVANHVALLQSTEGTSKKQEQFISSVCEKVFQKFPEFVKRFKGAFFEAMSDPMYSGKMRVLQKLLRHFLQRKDKVLLFSLSTKLLDVLESYCMAEGLEYLRLDGTTKAKERMSIVKEFNGSKNINLCLVSTMAGGLGLNFVGANVVILFDPTWNPANDLQAIDRVYRIGQCRDVTVFRLISLGTVEEVIYLRQVYKQQLESSVVGRQNSRRYFEAVQGTVGQAGELFGMRNLFRLQLDGTCLTQRILEREGRIEAGVMTAKTQAAEERPSTGQSRAGAEGPMVPPTAEPSSGTRATPGVLDFSSEEEEEGEGDGEAGGSSRVSTSAKPDEAKGTTAGHGGCLMGSFSELFLQGLGRTDAGVTSINRGDEGSKEEEEEGGDAHGAGPSRSAGKGAAEPDEWSQLSDGFVAELEEIEVRQSLNASVASMPTSPAHRGLEDTSRQEAEKDVVLETDEEDQHGHSSEEESEDLLAPHPTSVKHQAKKDPCVNKKEAMKIQTRPDEVMDSFSSDDDAEGQLTTLNRKSSGGNGCHKNVTFTAVKDKEPQQTSTGRPRQGGGTANVGTIDALLGGLNEVSYTHSNQRVVGSSRAENFISKAAVRDVFERQKYSQVPAHMLLDTQETQPAPAPPPPSDGSHLGRVVREQKPPRSTDGAPEASRVCHPVTHTLKAKHYLRNSTVIIGETPSMIRKSHFKLMADFFGAASVQAFANEILKCSSEQRQRMLKQYYSQQNPDLTDVLTQVFPEPPSAAVKPVTVAAPSSSSSSSSSSTSAALKPLIVACPSSSSTTSHPPTSSSSSKPVKKKAALKFAQTEHAPKRRICSASEDTEESSGGKKCKMLCPKTSSTNSGQTQASSSAVSGESKIEILTRSSQSPNVEPNDRLHPKPETRSASATSTEGNHKVTEVPQGPSTDDQSKNPHSSNSLITDLLGDTSILDQLFKPKRKAECADRSPSASSSLAPHTDRKAKGRSKDLWDILSEGNEESINKLTDLTQIEKICSASTSPVKRDSQSTESPLWRKNEKFLWKKQD